MNCSMLFSVCYCHVPAQTSANSFEVIILPTPHAVYLMHPKSLGIMHGATAFAVFWGFVYFFLLLSPLCCLPHSLTNSLFSLLISKIAYVALYTLALLDQLKTCSPIISLVPLIIVSSLIISIII